MKKDPNWEFVKQLLLAAQQGKPVQIVIVDEISELDQAQKQNHLSDEDRKLIKEAVLYRARNGSTDVLELAKALREGFSLINA